MSSATTVSHICDKFWKYQLQESPEFGVYCGLDSSRPTLDVYDVNTFAQRERFCRELLQEVQVLSTADLSPADALSVRILATGLRTCVEGLQCCSYLIPINYYEGPDTYFSRYTLSYLKLHTVEDCRLYLCRLAAFPQQVEGCMALMQEGVKRSVLPHKVALGGVSDRLAELVTMPAEQHKYMAPCLSIPDSIDQHTKSEIVQEAKDIITTQIQPSLAKLRKFLDEDYIPHLRTSLSVNSVPGLPDRYSYYLQFYTDLDWSPAKMHEVGLKEVQHLRDRLTQVMTKVGFTGRVGDFADFMAKQQHLHFKSEEDVISHCERIIEEVIRPKLKDYFFDITRAPLKLRPDPSRKQVAPAVYNMTAEGGVLWMADYRQLSTCDMLCLMAHEAEPGHHLQACATLHNQDLPMFRRIKDDRKYMEAPGRMPLNCAYTEGWAVYCEELADEMGLYAQDPHDEYGYLSFNLLRSARVVVDTGIHALGWSREQGEQYMRENTTQSDVGISKEVDRYITWPGQGCSYKVGHLKIRELRQTAQQALGEKFDIKRFHQVCLDNGQVPLPILDEIVQQYIQTSHT